MDYDASVAVYCFAGMLVLIFIGVPIFVSIIAATAVGFYLIGGASYVLMQFTTAPYNIAADYTLAVLPMFILMGVLAGESGLAEGAYNAVNRWLSRVRGGALNATIVASAVFGACSGVEFASIAIFTKVALPELTKFGYDKRISLGCITSAAGLSALIPPSVPIIIFCILAEWSIGQSLIAGILPGILVTFLLIGTVTLMGIISPHKIPRADTHPTWKERFSSLTLLWPILALFILVIGGIYAGLFPPIVGGAIGASGVFIYSLARGVSGKKIFNSFWETALSLAQLFPIFIAGFMFGRFVAMTGLPEMLVDIISGAGIHPVGVMGLVILIYLVLGCVMELLSIMIITIPLVVPVLTSVGFDPLTIVITLVFMGNLAGLTPPIGLISFFAAGVAKVDPTEVFRGIAPFLLALFAALWIVILVPSLTTWLPSLLY